MALPVVLAHEGGAHEPSEYRVPPILPLRLKWDNTRRRARDIHLKRGGQREGRVWHGARKIEEEWLRGRFLGGALDKGRRLRRHPLGIVRALGRLLVAAPYGRRLLEAAVRAHDVRDFRITEAAPAAAKRRAAASLVFWQREAEVVLANKAGRIARALEPMGDRRLGPGEKGVECDEIPRPVRGD